MVEVMTKKPRTIMEVFRMLPEGTLAEVIENTLYMSPTPRSNHQRISGVLFTNLNLHVTKQHLGEVFHAPFDVYLDEEANAVQPDIFFIAKEHSGIIEDHGYVHGVPDLIIEILSPGNKRYDQVTKKSLYERFQVKEYWIVDPETKETTGYEMKEGIYEEFFHAFGKLQSRLLNSIFNF
jgi:Uma2 family endonuclease